MSNFSTGVNKFQSNMHNIFGNLTKRNQHNQTETNDRPDLMEDDDDYSSTPRTKKPKSRRPKENNFTQQRLKAIHPILTATSVIPMLLILAIIFIPIGASMLKASNKIQDFAIDYSKCDSIANSNYFTEIPAEYYTYKFKSKVTLRPTWKLATNDSSIWDNYPEEKNICQIQFQIPNDLKSPIYFFYRLSNFYANHRRYVISFSEDQLHGKDASVSDIKDIVGQNCQPLSVDSNGKIIYPCGLIANSLFNDTYSSFTGVNDTNSNYELTNKDIAWSTNKDRFKKTSYNVDDIVPPPNWIKQFPNGYNESNLPDISNWPEFQNWMTPAALPTFSNMIMKNDDDELQAGTYQINVGLHFPTTEYNGGKFIYLSTRSAIGGRNSFLGVSWIVGGCICLGLVIILAIGVVLKGRKAGDTRLLSWNKENEIETENYAE